MTFFDPSPLPVAPAEKANFFWELLCDYQKGDCIDYYDGPRTLIRQDKTGQRWWMEDYGEEWEEGIHRRETWLFAPITKEERQAFFDKQIDYRNIKKRGAEIYFLHILSGWKGKNDKGIYQWEEPILTLHTAHPDEIPNEWLQKAEVYYSGRDLE